MINSIDKTEILAPAGSYESLLAAIHAGCDAVYFGVTQLNMRAQAAANFDLNDLEKINNICHENNVKAYLTLNTILYQHDMTLMREIINKCKKVGVDQIIVSDFAAIEYAKQIGQPMQISTMMSISNYEATKFFARYADTIVLAREVTLPMVKQIYNKIIEDDLRGPKGELIKLEAFVHGALCIAVSGRCMMSLYNHNASAARGACRQECRRAYKITDLEEGTEMVVDNANVMSPADLCTIDILDQIIDSGIAVLKIEGRGRKPEYVDTVVRCYREALVAIKNNEFNQEKIQGWKGRLEKVYNRNFSYGYYFGQNSNFWSKSGHNQATEERIHLGKVTHYYFKQRVAELIIEAQQLNQGDKVIFTGKTTGLVRCSIDEIRDENGEIISSAEKGSHISIKIPQLVRKGDKVYLLKEK